MSKQITNLKSYQKFVKSVMKRFDNPQIEIATWGLGLAGEAGDIAGVSKKLMRIKTIKRKESKKI